MACNLNKHLYNLNNRFCLIFESLEDVPGPMLERREVTEPRFRPEAEEEPVRCLLAAAAPSAAASGAAEDALEAAPGEPLLALPPPVAFFLICLKTFFMASR